MGKILGLLFCILLSNIASSYAQSCNTYSFTTNAVYATCVSLPVLNSHLHWNYHSSNSTVDLAFRHTGSDPSQWLAWALNINGQGMVGAQALVAVTGSNGSVRAYTSSVTGYQTGLQPSPLSFEVPSIMAERVNGVVVIYATLVLPRGRTSFNQVWQVGPVNNGAPSIHGLGADNRNSLGSVDFINGSTSAGGNIDGSRLRRKNVLRFGTRVPPEVFLSILEILMNKPKLLRIHVVLNVVSWIVLMPVGAMVARYLKVFPVAKRAWFHIHESIHRWAYILGVAGWATGLKLGSDSAGITHHSHRNIGIILFSFATLQVLTSIVRPGVDNKYRFYWNIHHHSLGYSIIILSIINVYEGLDILDSEKKWKNSYTRIFISLGVITVILEALTWFIVLKRKKEDKVTHAGGANEHA